MKNKYAEVYLWKKRIGIVSYEENEGIAFFEYDDNFINSDIEVSPIVMPLNRRVYSFPTLNKETFKGLPGLLADSLPDRFGDNVINSWLKNNGRDLSSFSPIERLCYTGKRGMGALEYVPSTGPVMDEEETIEVNRMVDVASKVLSNRRDLHLDEKDIGYANLLKFGTSAGGARAKAIVAWNEDTNEIFSGQIANRKNCGYWIIKFDEVANNGDHGSFDSKGYTKIEYAYYLMAKEAKINISECRLFEDHGMQHFMTRRFDRETETGEKIHMQTLGGIAHLDFNVPRSCSYELASNICLRLSLGNDEISELYRRMIFNVLAINNDDHVKNISFLMDRKGSWSLAPAYDLSFSYKSDSLWVNEHQMTINGKSNNLELNDLLTCAANMNISRQKAISIINEVQSAIKKWEEFALKANVNKEDLELIKKAIDKQVNDINI